MAKIKYFIPMLKKCKTIFIIAVIMTAILCLNAESVLAQRNGVGIKISPIRIENLVDPGEIMSDYVEVFNESNTRVTYYVYLKDFKAGDETGAPRLIAPGSEDGYFLASWIDITGEGIELGPGESKKVPFTITVPETTGPGGYYGGIYFGTQPPKLDVEGAEKGAGIAIAQQTGCLILLQVKGDALEEARIREFNTAKDLYSTPFDVEFFVRVENLGNVHVKPHGAVTITNMFGKEVAMIRFNEKGGNVLPNSIRKFTKINWKGDWGFGRYKASLGLSYGTPTDMGGQGKKSLFSEKYIWVMPWRIIIPTLLTLIFFTALLYLLLRLYKNKAIRRAMEEAGLGQVRYVRQYQGPSPVLHISLILLVIFIVLFLILSVVYFMLFA